MRHSLAVVMKKIDVYLRRPIRAELTPLFAMRMISP